MSLISVKNKVIVVTGAGKIGSHIIRALDEENAVVIILDVDNDVGKKVKSLCDHAIFRKGDFSNYDDVTNTIHFCKTTFGKIDGWINTAFPKLGRWGKENFCGFNTFYQNMNSHLWGHYISTRLVANTIMMEQKFGSVINFGSIYGVVAPDFIIYEGTNIKMPILYAMIKGAINMMSKYFAVYYGKYNIRFNIISPGGIFEDQYKKFVNRYEQKTPLSRMAKEEDIIGAVLFLMSDASSYITGQNIMIDGGWTI